MRNYCNWSVVAILKVSNFDSVPYQISQWNQEIWGETGVLEWIICLFEFAKSRKKESNGGSKLNLTQQYNKKGTQ